MSIQRGRAWGWPGGPRPADAPIALDDAALARARPAEAVGLAGGWLWRALGGPGAKGRLDTPDAMHIPLDLGRVWLDDPTAAHPPEVFANAVVARSPRWTQLAAILNGPLVRGPGGEALRLGGRAHPNDGLLDSCEWRTSWAESRRIRRRAPSGAHVPHPDIRERRAPVLEVDLGRALRVWIDDRPAGRARLLRAEVVPDAVVAIL